MPPLERLALAYAPAAAREDWLSLLVLDARLAGVVLQAREPMLAQLRLAWWRDRFNSDPAGWPKGEPLLARLAPWGDAARALTGLVDGWEALLAEPPLGAAAQSTFADGRISALAGLAHRLGERDATAAVTAARRWALAELALRSSDPGERAGALALLDATGPGRRVSRALRPLSVLAGLSERAARRGANEALSGPGALLAAIRLGITGS